MKKNKIKFKEFDPFKKNLKGEYLIEASAGTGKTFTIIIIYLRMLLGLYKKNDNVIPLNVEQILVVTFTDIAIQNLCKRIKKSIHMLYIGCIEGKSKYNIINKLIKKIKNRKIAITLLLRAELNMHNASIYTIHAFCQKIINLKNYEFQNFFLNKKIINDELILQQKASIFFWRKYFYNLPKKIIKIIFFYWKSPNDLLNSLIPFITKKSTLIIKYHLKNINILEQFHKNIKYINIIKKFWIKYKNIIVNTIYNSNVNKHIYNKKLINNWINIINLWSFTKTVNNSYPKQLLRFSQKILNEKTIDKKKIPKHILFKIIEKFLNKIINLKFLIILKAIKYINQYVIKEKKKKKKISFNDLLNILNKELNGISGDQISKDIRNLFPVVLVDEFQDTDQQQYNILKKIYLNQSKHIIFLIGDPKQAIYSFRGANIFTYLQASSEIKKCYTLKNNWRSSSTMVNSVNKLFSNRSHPFLFKNIVFRPIFYTIKKLNYHLIINDKIKPGITFWYMNKKISINLYKKKIAYQCAYKICKLIILGQKNKAFLHKNGKNQKITISDITILVRNRYESDILQEEFIKFNLPSIYLSKFDNIFETQEAKELFLLLKSILEPNKKKRIINFLASKLFNIDLSYFDNDKKKYFIKKIIYKFTKYKYIWEKKGILNMLETIFLKDSFFLQKNNSNYIKKKIVNILYLGELIQISCFNIKNNKIIIKWLLQQITYPNKTLLNKQNELHNDINKIKIMTIHKAKGLQFPIVWLPFISSNTLDSINNNGIIFHNRKNFEINIDFKKNNESIKLFLEESLSENLRLLYVALTRSIFHCSIGISNIKFNNSKQQNLYLSYNTSLNFLIKNKNNNSNINLKKKLNNLKNKDIWIQNIEKKKIIKLNIIYKKEIKDKYLLKFKNKNFNYKNKILLSYSQIKKEQDNYLNNSNNNYKHKFLNFNKKNIKKTQYTFPIGKNVGIIIHNILEKLNFTKPIINNFIKKELIKKNIDSSWSIILTKWLNNILLTPLGNNKIILSKINNANKKTEFEFFLSIKDFFSSEKFNNIINKYDFISNKLTKLNFQKIKGFLTGVIDLIFLWNQKYYIIDYKTNWLGYNHKYYQKKYLKKDICLNRYDIQYQIYTLALHKYLNYRIINYNYENNFGGVIFLYIRGIHKKKKSGILEIRPSYKLINELSELFY
ncbi:exodeoxyribonuclease V subunit beta [Enterobacteriaceae endosymbiont of Donacia clavipes]|uniref:exodeoxyribonuclease V subunit beta n=1 Tax=Enterobacteriaceae endosymbiont of Donacia clavipes TaxID=2675775 RepID=UPI001456C2AE|nr:exodeoxyribonuclease V subunit beta [Enterobacteriaceae endosymbiont of Donacia clavipes]